MITVGDVTDAAVGVTVAFGVGEVEVEGTLEDCSVSRFGASLLLDGQTFVFDPNKPLILDYKALRDWLVREENPLTRALIIVEIERLGGGDDL